MAYFSKDELDQMRAGGFMQAPANTAAKAPQKKKKNFWLDQVSTGLGIAGGIGGSFIAPVAGTAAGAGAGSALGEAIENIISGESAGKNVLKEGALGAVFGAGPMKLAKGGLALAGGKGLQGASQAAMTPLRQTAGKAITGAGDDLLIKQFRFTPSQLKNFKGKFGEDAAEVIKRYGFKNADEVTTKGVQPLQQQFDDLVNAIPGVTKDKLALSLKSKYEPLLKSGVEDSVALGKNLKGQADTLLKKYGDVIDAKELNAVRREFDSLVNYTERAANPARYGVNKRAADAIRKTLQEADPSGTLKNVGRELQKVNQFADNAAKQAQLGRGSNPLGLSTLLGGGMGAAGGGPLGAVGSAAGVAAVNSPAGRSVLAKGATALGGKLSQAGGGQTAKGIAGRVGASGVLRGMAAQAPQQEPQSLEDALMQSEGEPQVSGGEPVMEQQQEMSPYGRENLLSDIQRDPENADKYIEYYQSLQEIFGPQAGPELGNTAIARISDFESGISALDDLGQRIQSSGVNAPFIGDIRRRNPFDTEAQDLNSSIRSVRQLVGRALEGGVLRREDEIKYEQMLPKIGDTDDVAAKKLENVRRLLTTNLGAFKQNQGRYSGGGGSLEEALLQSQGAY